MQSSLVVRGACLSIHISELPFAAASAAVDCVEEVESLNLLANLAREEEDVAAAAAEVEPCVDCD